VPDHASKPETLGFSPESGSFYTGDSFKNGAKKFLTIFFLYAFNVTFVCPLKTPNYFEFSQFRLSPPRGEEGGPSFFSDLCQKYKKILRRIIGWSGRSRGRIGGRK
jgi:hypothetical protein